MTAIPIRKSRTLTVSERVDEATVFLTERVLPATQAAINNTQAAINNDVLTRKRVEVLEAFTKMGLKGRLRWLLTGR